MSPEKNENPQIEIKESQDAKLIFSIIDPVSDWLVDEKDMHHWKNYYTQEVIQQKLDNEWRFFIAYVDNNPVGVAAYSLNHPDYYESDNYSEAIKPIYFGALGVLPKYRNKGIGKALVSFRLEKVREEGADAIRFDARKDYTELIRFHENNGFERVGEIGDPDDGAEYVLFEKLLNDN